MLINLAIHPTGPAQVPYHSSLFYLLQAFSAHQLIVIVTSNLAVSFEFLNVSNGLADVRRETQQNNNNKLITQSSLITFPRLYRC